MASISPAVSPVPSHSVSSPPLKGIKKVLTSRRRSSEVQSDGGTPMDRRGRGSVGSFSLDKSPSRKSARSSPSRDGSSKSGNSGVRKLLPGHSKRQRRRQREEELKIAVEEVSRQTNSNFSTEAIPSIPHINRSTSSLTQDGDNSLLTDDSESDTAAAPSLVSRESHAGYLTISSPLITTTSVEERTTNGGDATDPINSAPALPATIAPVSADVSPSAHSVPDSTVSLPLPGLIDKADTLAPDLPDRGRRGSLRESVRGKSPVRKFKDVFASHKSQKSPKTSPERKAHENFGGGVNNLLGKAGSFSDRIQAKFPDKPGLSPVDTVSTTQQPAKSAVSLPIPDARPSTPEIAGPITPVTTITPPTPTGPQSPDASGSPRRRTEASTSSNDSGIVVSPSGNMISHRRVQSTSSAAHQPSKLSSSTIPPLTPTIEETKAPSDRDKERVPGARNVTVGSGFFSNWVSAAQNAATTFTSTLNTQSRARSGTIGSDASLGKPSEEIVRNVPPEAVLPESPKKQLAIETLGVGDLSFAHLGLEGSGEEKIASLRPDPEDLRRDSTVQKDEASAKVEGLLAKRAVSAAYEKPNDQTPIAELPDPIEKVRPAPTNNSMLLGDQSPPNGSIFEGDTGSVKRSTSVRSKLQSRRRSRGSSVATGTSTIGAAIVGASTATLANPASGSRFTGFVVAPKQRNRNFHQQFRSVPEDDCLIEDYSCALQREILLAGRIYISEGHICFSSNILGWVTTLVISFEEVVSIERETTAIVIPNAIAIQTLHARHTFRSLLSREATFDLLIGIWKVSHPASFKKSINGKQEAASTQQTVAEAVGAEPAQSDEESEESDDEDEDDDDDSGRTASVAGSAASMMGDFVDARSIARKPSGLNGTLVPNPGATAGAPAEVAAGVGPAAVAAEAQTDVPGPLVHAPTDCNDGATHYEKIIKDEIIPAPLGKVYSLLYGPASGHFVRKYLLDDIKVLELQFEDDKKGLSNETNSRQYTYIKPLTGSIGPKQTKCITTENLDFLDLEKSVSVTCTTQTPDVPSGSAFSVKTRYCLSWAPGNATRLQMNCGLEWTAKSWLKGPIEKGANEGQQAYGDGLVKMLNSAVTKRARAATSLSKGSKIGRKKKRRSEKTGNSNSAKVDENKKEENWGLFEPVRGFVRPVTTTLGPMASPWALVGLLVLVMSISWLRGVSSSASGAGFPLGYGTSSARVAAYEELWKREESELWDWLEDRVGVENLREGRMGKKGNVNAKAQKVAAQQQVKARKKVLEGKDMEARMREEKMSEREMEEQIRVTGERLEVLRGVVERKRKEREGGD